MMTKIGIRSGNRNARNRIEAVRGRGMGASIQGRMEREVREAGICIWGGMGST